MDEDRGRESRAAQERCIAEQVERLWALADKPDVPAWAAQELTFSQLRLLFLLNRHGPSPVSRIALLLGIGLPAASGVVDRVERHGLVERRHSQDDRRVVECGLTVAGKRLLGDIVHTRAGSIRSVLRVLDPADLDQVERIVGVLLERIPGDAPSPGPLVRHPSRAKETR